MDTDDWKCMGRDSLSNGQIDAHYNYGEESLTFVCTNFYVLVVFFRYSFFFFLHPNQTTSVMPPFKYEKGTKFYDVPNFH